MESWKDRPTDGLIPAVGAEVRVQDRGLRIKLKRAVSRTTTPLGTRPTGVLCGDPEGETDRRNEDVLALERLPLSSL